MSQDVRPLGTLSALREFRLAVRADHDAIRHYVTKYGSAGGVVGSLHGDFVTKVGFQVMVAYRLMRFFEMAGWPLLPQIASRLIRHLYGSDLHWRADFAPGVMIVHGMGLCVHGDARVGERCILFQHVTLGEGTHPTSRQTGAPRLEARVHVGPGATLLGPIVIGEGSKIMAGCVVTESVPAGSVVEAPRCTVRSRATQSTASGALDARG